MKKVEIYKDRFIKLIKEVNANGIEIQPYAERIEETGEVLEAGIALLEDDSFVVIRTYRNDILVGN